MATRYYQNKRAQEIIIPTYEGHTVSVKPYQFVIDGLGTYYTSGMGLTEVTLGDVVSSRVAYAYMPDEPTGIVIGNPVPVNGEYAVASVFISNLEGDDYFLRITSKTKNAAFNDYVCTIRANIDLGTTEYPDSVIVNLEEKLVDITLAWVEPTPDNWVYQTTSTALISALNSDPVFSQYFVASVYPSIGSPIVLTNTIDSETDTTVGGITEVTSYVPAPPSGSGFCYNPENHYLYVYDPTSGIWEAVTGGGGAPGGATGTIQYNNEGTLAGIPGSSVTAGMVQIMSPVGTEEIGAAISVATSGTGENVAQVAQISSQVSNDDTGSDAYTRTVSRMVLDNTVPVSSIDAYVRNPIDAVGSSEISTTLKLGNQDDNTVGSVMTVSSDAGSTTVTISGGAIDDDPAVMYDLLVADSNGTNGVNTRLTIEPASFDVGNSLNGNEYASLTVMVADHLTSPEDTKVEMFVDNTSGSKGISIAGTGITVVGLTEHADDAAAKAAGLVADMLYKTPTGELRIVLPVAP